MLQLFYSLQRLVLRGYNPASYLYQQCTNVVTTVITLLPRYPRTFRVSGLILPQYDDDYSSKEHTNKSKSYKRFIKEIRDQKSVALAL